jgi:hypothetical protein
MTTKDFVKSFRQMFKNELHDLIPTLEGKSHTMDELSMILLPVRQSGYNLYQKMMHQKLTKNPAPFKDKSRDISKKWKKLTESERSIWNEKAANIKDMITTSSKSSSTINPPTIIICKGIIKNSNQPCKSKSKYNGYCGKHKSQINDNNFVVIEHSIVREEPVRTETIIDGVSYWIDFYNKVFISETIDSHIGYFDIELNKIQVLDENMDF